MSTASRKSYRRLWMRKWYKKRSNKRLQSKRCKAWRKANMQKVRDYMKTPKPRAYARKWWREQKAKVTNTYIAKNLRTRIYAALKGNRKTESTVTLLGCSVHELKLHLQGLFTPEMHWNNYGLVWEIDHITPCASFNLTLPSEQQKCFHYTNLQPLRLTQNRSKGARVVKLENV